MQFGCLTRKITAKGRSNSSTMSQTKRQSTIVDSQLMMNNNIDDNSRSLARPPQAVAGMRETASHVLHSTKSTRFLDVQQRNGLVRRASEKISLPVRRVLCGPRTSLYHTALLNYIKKTSRCPRVSRIADTTSSVKQSNPIRRVFSSFHAKIASPVAVASSLPSCKVQRSKLEEPSLYPSVSMVEAIPSLDVDQIFANIALRKKLETKGDQICVIEPHSCCQNSVSSLGSGSDLSESVSDFETSSFRNQSSPRLRRTKSTSWFSSRKERSFLFPHDSVKSIPVRKQLKPEFGLPLPSSVSVDPQIEIELSPGVQLNLRGSSETWQAIQTNRARSVHCACCDVGLFCVPDAEFVICPDCRVVSPLSRCGSHKVGIDSKMQLKGSGGVGLGVKATLVLG